MTAGDREPQITPQNTQPLGSPSPLESSSQPAAFLPGAKATAKQKLDYNEQLKEDFAKIFAELKLDPIQNRFLESRWLDQVLWMEGRAARARDRHYQLRLITIIGGVIIPALVSLTGPGIANNDMNRTARQILGWSAFFLSQAVAISAATEQFFNYGERWRHYRRNVELLKSQGWQFFQLSGTYATYRTAPGKHSDAFPLFASQIEEIIQRDVEVYASQVVQEKKQEESGEPLPKSTNS